MVYSGIHHSGFLCIMIGNWGQKRQESCQYIFMVVLVGPALGLFWKGKKNLRNVRVDICDGLHVGHDKKERSTADD